MMSEHSALAQVDALRSSISALRMLIMQQVSTAGLVSVADIPDFWLALFDDRHPGLPRPYRDDGEPVLSATALLAFLHDIDAMVALHVVGLELDRPLVPGPDSPILHDWSPVILSGFSDELALIGTVSGHPRLRDGRTIVTSNLAALHIDRNLARTMSRLYALGDRSNLAKLRGRPDVAIRPGIRQATDTEVRHLMIELRLRVTEATAYLVGAGLIETENR